MASVKISKINSVIANMRYLTNEKSHDGIHDRIGSISTQNMSIFNAEWEAISNMKHWGKENNVQGYSIIQSFDKDELDPESQEDLERANEAGMKLAMDRAGDDRQILVVTQADNGYVHNHILMMSTAMSDGYALDTKQLKRSYVIEASDKILAEMQIRNKNAEMDRDKKKSKESMSEIKRRSKGQYVWKDDLRDRIDEALINDGVKNNDEFSKVMSDKGVDVMYHEKTGNISYKFKDQEGKDRKCRASRLGDGYGKKNVDKIYEENIAKDKEKASTVADIDWGNETLNNLAKAMQERHEREAEVKKEEEKQAEIARKEKAQEQINKTLESMFGTPKQAEPEPKPKKVVKIEKPVKQKEPEKVVKVEKQEEDISKRINAAPTIAERIKIAQEQADKDKEKARKEAKQENTHSKRRPAYQNFEYDDNKTKDDMQLGY